MTIPYAVELIARSQGPGRYICPKCCGGSDGERCLSIEIDVAGGIHWRCWRASCGYTGGPRGVRSVFATRKKEPRYFTRPTQATTLEQDYLFLKAYGLPAGTVTKYSPTDDRFLLPVRGPDSQLRGYIARSMSGAIPKTLTFNEKPDEPFLHWAPNRYDSEVSAIVVVEDWFSAEKVALTCGPHATGVALMGTTLSDGMVYELAKPDLPVYLALDLDAFGKALAYQARYRHLFPKGLKVWRLRVDLKSEKLHNIERALRGDTDNFGDLKVAGGV